MYKQMEQLFINIEQFLYVNIFRAGHDTQQIYNRYNYNYTLFLIIDTTTITLKKIIINTITNTKCS